MACALCNTKATPPFDRSHIIHKHIRSGNPTLLGGGGLGSCSSDAALSKLTLVSWAGQSTAVCLGNLSRWLREVDLDVARVTLVGVDSTVGTVSAPAGLGGLVDADVADLNVLHVQALGLSVGLGVLEQAVDELDRLDGPSTLCGTVLVSLGGSANTTVVAAERNAVLSLSDGLEVGVRLLQLHAVDGSDNLCK